MLLPQIIFAQWNLKSAEQNACCIYNYQFTNCLEPNTLFSAYNFYWAALSGISPERNLLASEQVIAKAFADLDNKPYEFVSLKLLNSRILITQANYLQALLNLKELKPFFQHYHVDSTNGYNQLLWGLYHYYASSAREQSFIYKAFLKDWPKSDRSYGLTLINQLKNNTSIFVKTEAYYFLSKIYLNSEKDFELASQTIDWLRTEYPDNTIYFELYLKLCMLQNQKNKYNSERIQYIQYLQKSNLHSEAQVQHFIKQNKAL